MTVGAICNRSVVTAERDESVAVVARRMREHRVGDVVVVEGSGTDCAPLGVLTDRDLVIEVLAAGVDPDAVTVGDILTHELVSLHHGEQLPEATALMRGKGVRRLVVVGNDGELVGILTVDDVLDVLAEEMGNLARLVIDQGRHQQPRRLAL